jgi:uncharacterized membrane protein YgcG
VDEARSKVRRLRVALGGFAVVVLVITGALGGVATALQWDGLLSPGPAWDDRYTLNRIDTVGTLHDDGTFTVVEDIVAEWHEPRRGLIRDIAMDAPGGTLGVDDIEVTSDTQDDVWFEVRNDDLPGHVSVHLGEEHDYRPLGQDHYRITYELQGLPAEVDGTPTLRWDAFGFQWSTLIEEATVALELPGGEHETSCVVGSEGQAFECTRDSERAWSAEDLRPGRGMTVQAQLDEAALDVGPLPPADLGPLEEFSNLAWQRLLMVFGLTLAAALPLAGTVGTPATWARRRVARERVDTVGAAYMPPSGMRPLTGAPLAAGEASGVDNDDLFAAWLLDIQQRDLAALEPVKGGFRVRRVEGGQPDSQAEQQALEALVAGNAGWQTWNKKTSPTQAKKLDDRLTKLRQHHVAVAGVPARFSSRVGVLGAVLIALAALIAWALWTSTPVVSVAIGVAVAGCWWASSTTDRWLRTAVAELDERTLPTWRQVEGLRRFVGEAHAGQIDGLADDPNVPLDSPYLQLLPWVVAFGYGEVWADKFPSQIGRATEQRHVYAPIRPRDVRQVRAVTKPPSSSSSGGGGGASGGGSGGGGGGGSSR